MAKDYGIRLRQARKHAGLTQVQLSKKTGIPQSTISTAERSGQGSGETPVYAVACGVDALWLATGEGEMVRNSSGPDDSDQITRKSGLEVMRSAVNILVTCLLDLDEDSRKEAGHLLQEMAASPSGRWSGRLIDLIEKESITNSWDAIRNPDRAGNPYTKALPDYQTKIENESDGPKLTPALTEFFSSAKGNGNGERIQPTKGKKRHGDSS